MFKIGQGLDLMLVLTLVNIIALCQGEVIEIPLRRVSHEDGQHLRYRRDANTTKGNLQGESGEGYYIEMEIGTPPQKLNVLVDTGSSNFAIAAAPNDQITKFFLSNESSTYEDSGTSVYVPYTQGDWTGELGTETVQIASLPNISVTANIAFITQSSNFFINTSNWQGIIGFGYKEISRPDGTLEPYFDSLVSIGHVDNIFSLHLCGARALPNTVDTNTSANSMDGTMILGGTSSSLYTGDIFYTPIHKEWYYEVVISDIKVDNDSLDMDCKEYNYDKTIVDSGTTNLRLPDKVFQSLVSRIKAALGDLSLLEDEVPGEYFWTGDDVKCWGDLTLPYTSFPTVTLSLITTNNTYFSLTLLPQQYLRPVQDPTDITMNGYCFKFGIATSAAGTVLGAVVMEGYYVIFDRENKRMGFAETTCPPRAPDLNSEDTKITGPFTQTGTSLLQCAYVKPERNSETLLVVAYVMAAVCVICVLPLLIMVIQYQVRKCRGPTASRDGGSDTGSFKGVLKT